MPTRRRRRQPALGRALRTCPTTSASRLLEGSIADDAILERARRPSYDQVFHLATFHGNQNSIAEPLADHENNLITTLKLYEHAEGISTSTEARLRGVGLHAGRDTTTRTEADAPRTGPVPLDLDSPYQISKVVGEFYSRLLPPAARPADRARALPERLRAGRDARRRAVARHAGDGLAQRHADVRLPRAEGHAAAPRQRRRGQPRLHLRRRHRRGPDLRCAERGAPGDVYNLASGVETTIRRAGGADQRARPRANPELEIAPAARLGPLGPALRLDGKAERELGFRAETPIEEGLGTLVDWMRGSHAHDRPVHRASSRSPLGGGRTGPCIRRASEISRDRRTMRGSARQGLAAQNRTVRDGRRR